MNFTTELRAFHGDAAIKDSYLRRVRAHAAADEIVQGQYWEHGRGCAVGCTIHSSEHGAYETELGIPEIVARIEDILFERMALSDAKGWPHAFLDAIPVGADLSLVWPKLAVWLLTDPTDGVLRFAKTDDVAIVVTRVAHLYEMVIAGAEVDEATWRAARTDAYAARRAAWRRYEAAAAAVAVVEAAAAAVAVAAVEAEVEVAVADWSVHNSARSGYALRASSKLLEILASSPVPVEA